jgi:hypothetical protein
MMTLLSDQDHHTLSADNTLVVVVVVSDVRYSYSPCGIPMPGGVPILVILN